MTFFKDATTKSEGETFNEKRNAVKHLGAVRGSVVIFALIFCATTARGQNGNATFKTNCTPCHGDDGSGNTPTGKSLKAADLRAPEIQKNTDTELATLIANGKGNMPAFKSSLSDDQITNVTAHIRTLKKK